MDDDGYVFGVSAVVVVVGDHRSEADESTCVVVLVAHLGIDVVAVVDSVTTSWVGFDVAWIVDVAVVEEANGVLACWRYCC